MSVLMVYGPPLLLCAAGILICGLRLRQGWQHGYYSVPGKPPRNVIRRTDRPEAFWALTALLGLVLATAVDIALLILFYPVDVACDWTACL